MNDEILEALERLDQTRKKIIDREATRRAIGKYPPAFAGVRTAFMKCIWEAKSRMGLHQVRYGYAYWVFLLHGETPEIECQTAFRKRYKTFNFYDLDHDPDCLKLFTELWNDWLAWNGNDDIEGEKERIREGLAIAYAEYRSVFDEDSPTLKFIVENEEEWWDAFDYEKDEEAFLDEAESYWRWERLNEERKEREA